MPTKPKSAAATQESIVDDAVESELADELVASGARPVSVNIDDLVRRIEDLQAAQAKMMAERGIPADPLAAQIQALGDHVRVQANANPAHTEDYAKLLSHVDSLDSKKMTPDIAAKTVRLVSRVQAKHPQHELAYVRQLAEDLQDSED